MIKEHQDVRLLLDPPPAVVSLHDGSADSLHAGLFLTNRELVEVGRFDVSHIDRDFLLHTGREIRDELTERGGDEVDKLIQLPYSSCIFEFSREIVVADMFLTGWGCHLSDAICAGDEPYMGRDWSTGIRGRVIKKTKPVSAFVDANEIWQEEDRPEFTIQCANQWEIEEKYWLAKSDYCAISSQNGDDSDRERQTIGGQLLLGLLCLLSERLLINEKVTPARTPTKNARAIATGKLPRHKHSVLTLNLAETKRRTSRIALMAHESPRLHWRRGHWRTLHRLSEFEKRTWVKRCLVGDPGKGFVTKHYRAIWQPRLH